MKLGPNRLRIDVERGGEVGVNPFELLHGPIAIKREPGHLNRIKELGGNSRPGVARNGNVIDVLERESGLRQAVADRGRGESRRVLHAVEAFFFHRRHQPPIAHDRRRGVGVISINAQNIHRFILAQGVAQGGGAAPKRLWAGELTPHPAAHGRHPLPSERVV
jgi:hypothetical protein